jgi:Cyanobacterial TRADD-N associated 2-Transmembrane domain
VSVNGGIRVSVAAATDGKPSGVPIPGDEELLAACATQALDQARMTFRASLVFMSLAGLVVLAAGVMALAQTPTDHAVTLISALTGAVMTGSGAAFSVRADRARRHMERQTDRIRAGLISERTAKKAAGLIAEVTDPTLRDQARVVLALLLSGMDASSAESIVADMPNGTGGLASARGTGTAAARQDLQGGEGRGPGHGQEPTKRSEPP